jgi:hypothetical protein
LAHGTLVEHVVRRVRTICWFGCDVLAVCRRRVISSVYGRITVIPPVFVRHVRSAGKDDSLHIIVGDSKWEHRDGS